MIQWNKLAVFLIVIPVLVVLTWFVRSTRQGKAMRAVAQDKEASAMMGIDVNRTISVTFFLAGALAAAPGLVYLLQFNIRYDTGFELGLIAFTAAVLGGIGNLTGAVLGAMLIGMVQAFNEGLDGTPGGDWTRSIVFGILIAVLVFRPAGHPRRTHAGGGMTTASSTTSSSALRTERGWWVARGADRARADLPAHRRDLQDLPLIGDFVPRTGSMVIMLVFTMMALGLNVVVGYAGLLDLGYVAFYAAGAYVAGWFASLQFDHVTFHFGSTVSNDLPGIHLSMWLVLALAGVFTMIVGILIGLPTLRLRGDYLAIVTLGFGEIIPQVVRNADEEGIGFDLTNGTFGIAPIDSVGFGRIHLPHESNKDDLYYWTAFLLVLFTVFCCIRLRDSRLGRAWIAIREDETAAAAMGVPLMRTKTWSYAIGAFFGGVAGAFYASYKAAPSRRTSTSSSRSSSSAWSSSAGWGRSGACSSAADPQLPQHPGARDDRLEGPGGRASTSTRRSTSSGSTAIIIVVMMLFRPTGLIPERRHKIELEEGVHDTPFYDVQHEGAMTDRDPSDD